MQKPDAYLTTILIVFLSLLLVKCLQPSTDARDLATLGGTIITGIFALMQTRKTPTSGDDTNA